MNVELIENELDYTLFVFILVKISMIILIIKFNTYANKCRSYVGYCSFRANKH